MHDILIRGLAPDTIQRLKAQAKRNGRSLQKEAKAILEHAAGYTRMEAVAVGDEWRRKPSAGGQRFNDSAALIREDRTR